LTASKLADDILMKSCDVKSIHQFLSIFITSILFFNEFEKISQTDNVNVKRLSRQSEMSIVL